ncbi:MAG: hypothetical protein AB1758_08475 [Candidatus Eremiobacterota bacterium]
MAVHNEASRQHGQAWQDEHGFLETAENLAEEQLESIEAREFEQAWTAATPANQPTIRRESKPVPATVSEVQRIVARQLDALPWPEVVAHLRRHLVPPRLHWRRWDYGFAEEYPCWMVAEWPERGLGVVFCAYGHPQEWGVVKLDRPWFGMDALWKGTLVETQFGFGLYDGRRPQDDSDWLSKQARWCGGVEGPGP